MALARAGFDVPLKILTMTERSFAPKNKTTPNGGSSAGRTVAIARTDARGIFSRSAFVWPERRTESDGESATNRAIKTRSNTQTTFYGLLTNNIGLSFGI